MKNNTRAHLNNLDSLRFLAASLVIVHHIERFKGLAGWHQSHFAEYFGLEGVRFFFVLSGFLISYLLLSELNQVNHINVGKFYTSRILRIWPLYYLTVAISFFLLPNFLDFKASSLNLDQIALKSNYQTLLFYYLVFVPNLAGILFAPVLGASQCWSIGVEEQFYILWPFLVKWIGNKPFSLMLGVVIGKILAVNVLGLVANNSITHIFIKSFSIEGMAMGGIFAVLFLKNKRDLGTIRNFLLTLALVLVALTFYQGVWDTVALLLYGILVFVASKSKPWFGIFYKPLEELGRMSYGFYMLHSFAILLSLDFLICHGFERGGAYASHLLYASSILLSVVFTVTSYWLYEKPFLRLKLKLSSQCLALSGKEHK